MQRCNRLYGKVYSLRYRTKHPQRRVASCARYRKANAAAEKKYRRMYCAANLDKLAAKAAHRRALKMNATPVWYEHSKVMKLYARARRQKKHVDHIVPLNSKRVCGLHCFSNLRLLSRAKNLSKGNRVWPGMWPIVREPLPLETVFQVAKKLHASRRIQRRQTPG